MMTAEPRPPDEPLDLARLVHEHHQALYRYAYRLSGSTADAEDLTQQTLLVAQQKLDQVRQPEQVRAWLMAVLRNCYLQAHRRPIPIPACGLPLDMNSIPNKDPQAFDIDRQTLQQAIDELPEAFKVVLLMFYFEHRSYTQIAEALDLPTGTVMSRLSRAKCHLRRRLLAEEEVRSDR